MYLSRSFQNLSISPLDSRAYLGRLRVTKEKLPREVDCDGPLQFCNVRVLHFFGLYLSPIISYRLIPASIKSTDLRHSLWTYELASDWLSLSRSSGIFKWAV